MTGEKFRLDNGFEVEIVSNEAAERADWVICVPWSVPAIYDDDERGECFICGEPVRFRPYMPKTPPKLCLPCLLAKRHIRQ